MLGTRETPPAIEAARQNGDEAHFDIWMAIKELQTNVRWLILLGTIIVPGIVGLYFA